MDSASDRGLISKVYKELKKLDINKLKWGTDVNREFSNGRETLEMY